MNLLPRAVHLVRIADGFHGVMCVTVGADAVGIFLIEDRAAYHDFAPRSLLLEQGDRFLHGRNGCRHQRAQTGRRRVMTEDRI